MNVLVDTSVWSHALRRRPGAEPSPLSIELSSLVQDGRVVTIGPIRQEILSGIRDSSHFERLREHLGAFPDMPIATGDYEEAARHFDRCRQKGIQGSNTDFLICAVAMLRNCSIFTEDDDFTHFAKVLPITLHRPGG